MAVLVDTNVICDVLYNDPVWSDWSYAQLAHHWGQLCINPIICAELSYQSSTPNDVNDIMKTMGLAYADLPVACLFAAGQAYRSYRQRGGLKTAPLPDFFIGAHAQELDLTLLTRDKARFETYFPRARLICP
jgi:predicted nucleic acid-binding protein